MYLLGRLEEPKEPFWSPRSGCHCLELLHIAQSYELKALEKACVEKAKLMSFSELKNHKMYERIGFPNYRMIAEGTIEKMEKELRNKGYEVSRCKSSIDELKSSASDALKELENTISIVFLACKNGGSSFSDRLNNIRYSGGEFKKLYGPLSNLRDKLRRISN